MSQKQKFIVLLSAVLFMGGCASAPPQKDIQRVTHKQESTLKELGNGEYEVTGSALIENLTPQQAREEAKLRARKLALEHYAGVEIQNNTLMLKSDHNNNDLMEAFSSISSQTSRGVIIKEELLSEETIADGSSMRSVVRLRVKAAKQVGQKNPAFHLNAKLNREVFTQGEELKLEVQPSLDCYLTIINIGSDGNVYLLLPNQYTKMPYVKAGENYRFPPERSGIALTPTLLPGRSQDSELIKIIATLSPVVHQIFSGGSSYGAATSTLPAMQKWLLAIPADQYLELDLVYHLYK
ncbi:MAG TPA: DUF4384 domain-containing protein [Candidatus Marinimicrobia bacterium]|nr:DUF4384 domain-containing protein [Candidatus Neomarinimicrobiota bacterium]